MWKRLRIQAGGLPIIHLVRGQNGADCEREPVADTRNLTSAHSGSDRDGLGGSAVLRVAEE